ncbi:hypothetical protein BASA50_005462 [Batrachochytrium salamandrivorans]|uniref:Uncharacterized protein n=1 Tax=Batrachochytrium salamandrivorans TaxID=1357716 RepID=A0ABQ8FCM9_9FUNG|nr:hypothetical protein BASA50_005462 [Batrachochytrium salamandrivorans]
MVEADLDQRWLGGTVEHEYMGTRHDNRMLAARLADFLQHRQPAISSFAAKTVTTIQRSPDVKARNFFRSLLASIGGKTLEAATAEATKIRVQTPSFSISTIETAPKESLPIKKATEQGPAAPAVDPPSNITAEVTSATQDDGVAPTVTPIADVEMCL